MTKFLSVCTSLFVCVGGAAICFSFSGCGDSGLDTVPVSGTVSYDGKPLNNGMVRFVPVEEDGLLATGKIGPDGSFTLGTRGTSGVQVGEYKVSVQSNIIDESVPAKDRELGIGGKESAIPEKYNDPATSGLTETVDGSRTIDIELKPE